VEPCERNRGEYLREEIAGEIAIVPFGVEDRLDLFIGEQNPQRVGLDHEDADGRRLKDSSK